MSGVVRCVREPVLASLLSVDARPHGGLCLVPTQVLVKVRSWICMSGLTRQHGDGKKVGLLSDVYSNSPIAASYLGDPKAVSYLFESQF